VALTRHFPFATALIISHHLAPLAPPPRPEPCGLYEFG
jgi:hypothetical protein